MSQEDQKSALLKKFPLPIDLAEKFDVMHFEWALIIDVENPLYTI